MKKHKRALHLNRETLVNLSAVRGGDKEEGDAQSVPAAYTCLCTVLGPCPTNGGGTGGTAVTDQCADGAHRRR